MNNRMQRAITLVSHGSPASTMIRVLRVSALFCCVITLLQNDIVHAFSTTQQNLFSQGNNYYDLETDQCGVGGSAQATSVIMPTDATPQDKIAQTFMIGFPASTDPQTIIDLVTKYKFGGIYLTGTNDAASLGFNSAFYGKLDAAAKVKMMVASDEEGGQVHRYAYTGDFANFPSAKDMGKMDDDALKTLAQNVGGQMKTNGITVDLAPVLDIDNGKSDGAISKLDRSFSSDPNVITDKAGAFASGLSSAGVTPVLKHFPGLGNATPDSNTDDHPAKSPDIATLKAQDLIPYSKLIGQNGSPVMLSNEIVTGVDDKLPGSESPAVVNLLRNDYKFNGLIMTDDLKPASSYDGQGGLPNSIAAAEKAGVNMPLFTYTSDADIAAAIAAVQTAATPAQIATSLSKVIAVKGGGDANTVAPTTSGTGTSGCCSQGGTTLVSGTDNTAAILNYIQKPAPAGLGLNFTAAIGVGANIDRESSFNPSAIGGPAHGIAQWQGSRWTSLQNFATAHGKDWTDLGLQLDFMNSEFVTYQGFVASLNSASDSKAAAELWLRTYERASDPKATDTNNRFVDELLSKYNSGSAQAIGAGSTTSGSSGCGDSNGFTGDAGDGKVISCPNDTSIKCTKSIYYSQYDGPWGTTPFPDCNDGNHGIGACGCGVTAASMAIATLSNNSKVTPGSLLPDWISNGLTKDGGTGWDNAGWTAVGAKYGVTVANITQHQNAGMTDDEIQKVIDAVNGGALVVSSGRGEDPFTGAGHFIVIRGWDATNKQFLISDPNNHLDKVDATGQTPNNDATTNERWSTDILKKYGETAWTFTK